MSALGFTAEQVKQVAELSSKITHEVNAGRIATLESELAQLRAEVEGMREDAERYRLARAGKGKICICQETIVQVDDPYGDGGAMGDWKDETRMVPITGKKADAAIDAARKEADRG